jgi:metal-dependent hydrolase (beta-lactamase superfamily II)
LQVAGITPSPHTRYGKHQKGQRAVSKCGIRPTIENEYYYTVAPCHCTQLKERVMEKEAA